MTNIVGCNPKLAFVHAMSLCKKVSVCGFFQNYGPFLGPYYNTAPII